EPEAPPQQPSRSTSNPGIGGITDGFEAVIPADSIFNVSQTSPQPPQREVEKDQTIDFSEVFGHLGDDSASQVSQPSVSGNEPVDPHESENLNSILNNPNVPFEEKLALFLFDFMEKAEKDLLSKMEQLEKSRTTQKSNPAENPSATNQSADVEDAANGKSTDSEQVAMEKLKIAHDKMTRIFSTIDNLLTSNNKSIKDGPIASLR
ncbi:hypothetical protein L0152_06915, partial [bacterium]|nr:hypothetical protein [bacterium]